jgi:hypothetical protein
MEASVAYLPRSALPNKTSPRISRFNRLASAELLPPLGGARKIGLTNIEASRDEMDIKGNA